MDVSGSLTSALLVPEELTSTAANGTRRHRLLVQARPAGLDKSEPTAGRSPSFLLVTGAAAQGLAGQDRCKIVIDTQHQRHSQATFQVWSTPEGAWRTPTAVLLCQKA